MKKGKVVWVKRYSKTLESDKFGRWGRELVKINTHGFYRLAYIKKVDVSGVENFRVVDNFPSGVNGYTDISTHIKLKEAKKAVEKRFKEFRKNINK